MFNLYQSQIRKDIQKEVYQNPVFDVTLFGKEYVGVIKEKKLGSLNLKWYQILGVELPDDEKIVKKELDVLKKKYSQSKNIFLQLGIVNEIVRFENAGHVCEEFKHDMRSVRFGLRSILGRKYSLKTSFRENMPQAGIVYNVTKSDDELLADMNESCRKRVKKSRNAGLEFSELSSGQEEIFYEKRQSIAGKKGFNVILRKQYDRLIEYMKKNKAGTILVAMKDGEIVAGSICVYASEEYMVCLYGFADRNFGKLGLNHYLKFETFGWARKQGFSYVDTMGGAPTGFPEHDLTAVTEFKESLGGQKIELCGNYDVVLNKFLYWVFKLWYKFRK